MPHACLTEARQHLALSVRWTSSECPSIWDSSETRTWPTGRWSIAPAVLSGYRPDDLGPAAQQVRHGGVIVTSSNSVAPCSVLGYPNVSNLLHGSQQAIVVESQPVREPGLKDAGSSECPQRQGATESRRIGGGA